MLWYFKNKKCYEYPSNILIDNSLSQRFYNSVYENSSEMEFYYSLAYMKNNNIPALTAVFPINELSVNYGGQLDINKNFCDKNGIHYRYLERKGGCMVFFPGNIIIEDVFPIDNQLRQHKYVQDFVQWLGTKSIIAGTNNNDVLINGKKVIGTTSAMLPFPYEEYVYLFISISINSNAELIDKICTKPMNKIPGALSDYGITTEEVMKWTLNWFNSHQYIKGEESNG